MIDTDCSFEKKWRKRYRNLKLVLKKVIQLEKNQMHFEILCDI